MQFQQITPHHEYNGDCIGLMNLDVPNLPETLEIEGYTLLRKPEFHITLMCPKKVAPLINPDDFEGTKAGLVAFFADYATRNDLTKYALRPEFRLIKRGEQVTVVVMADMPGLVGLFDALQAKFNITVPLQPAHITIYSLQYNMGIGINSPQELQQMSHVVSLPLTI
jgi:hypothetical protein